MLMFFFSFFFSHIAREVLMHFHLVIVVHVRTEASTSTRSAGAILKLFKVGWDSREMNLKGFCVINNCSIVNL